jgi:nitrogen regulatory protein P-II 2
VKLVSLIIEPHGLEPLRVLLAGLRVGGLTVTEVYGFGKPGSPAGGDADGLPVCAHLPKLRIDAAVDDALAGALIAALQRTAGQGGGNHGTLLVMDLQEVVRIRTGERGHCAV